MRFFGMRFEFEFNIFRLSKILTKQKINRVKKFPKSFPNIFYIANIN